MDCLEARGEAEELAVLGLSDLQFFLGCAYPRGLFYALGRIRTFARVPRRIDMDMR